MTDLRHMTTGEAEAFREGFEAAKLMAADICERRRLAEMQTLTREDGSAYESFRTHADRREAWRCATAIRAMDVSKLAPGE